MAYPASFGRLPTSAPTGTPLERLPRVRLTEKETVSLVSVEVDLRDLTMGFGYTPEGRRVRLPADEISRIQVEFGKLAPPPARSPAVETPVPAGIPLPPPAERPLPNVGDVVSFFERPGVRRRGEIVGFVEEPFSGKKIPTVRISESRPEELVPNWSDPKVGGVVERAASEAAAAVGREALGTTGPRASLFRDLLVELGAIVLALTGWILLSFAIAAILVWVLPFVFAILVSGAPAYG